MGEGVIPDLDILDTYVKATYPDLRKCINMVQMNAQEGKLIVQTQQTSQTQITN